MNIKCRLANLDEKIEAVRKENIRLRLLIKDIKTSKIIFHTKKYHIFVVPDWMRELDIEKAEHYREIIKRKDLKPIVVDENFILKDGQHRLYAYEKEKKAIPYILVY